MPWALAEVPLDCSGSGRGEERAPRALREAGILERTGARDTGEVEARIEDSRRDPATGVVGAEQIRRVSQRIAGRVREIRAAGDRPLLVGGDCTLLLGALQALDPGPGLWFVDGHADFYDGDSSPTGEAADMDLAIVTGSCCQDLLGLERTLVEPANVALLGHRPSELSADVARENSWINPAIHALTAPEIIDRGASRIGAEAADRLAGREVWLHLDLDVLDDGAFGAVTYPQPGGLGWQELLALLRPLVAAPNLAGVSVADFNPDRDREGRHVVEVVAAAESLLNDR